MAPPKGKAPTKGAKQIVTENAATISFYRNMALAATGFYGAIVGIFYMETFTSWILIVLNALVVVINIGCYKTMTYISRPTYSETNQLLDPGLDLNMEGGMGEHFKDIIILSCITHALAAISNYFWFLLLLLPLRALWLLWTNVLGPWFFQEAPEENKQEMEKKNKKIERKMKKYQQ